MGKGAGADGTAHPIHLHGHHFYVIAMGYPEYNPDTFLFMKNNKDINCTDTSYCSDAHWSDQGWHNGNIVGANFNNPPKKDTVFVPVGGYAVLRFKSDNIGYWFLHCHIEVHQGEGMAIVIKEGSDSEIINQVDFNAINTCGNGPDNLDKLTSKPVKLTTKPVKPINGAVNMIVNLYILLFLILHLIL